MLKKTNYQSLANFCPFNTPVDDPVTYCVMDGKPLDNKFAHGGTGNITPYSRQCQAFMSSRCANNWDSKCELASLDKEVRYPNMIGKCGNPHATVFYQLTAGDILVQNVAEKKYGKLVGNCEVKREQFDPTVLTSPFVEYQVNTNCSYGDSCRTIYDVNPLNLDSDPVMNKLLDNPNIAPQLLYKLYHSLKNRRELNKITNTRLGKYYAYNNNIYN